MKAQIVEQVEFFSEAELESLEFLPEELEAIEAERVPNLDSISFEDVAEDLEAYFEENIEEARLGGRRRGGRRKREKGTPELPSQISNQQYNKARDILISAGSQSARKSHLKHGRNDNPVAHGLQLLREARNEFANNPQGLLAIRQAAKAMGIFAQLGKAVW